MTLELGEGRYALTQINPRTGERTWLGDVDGGSRSLILLGRDQALVARRV